MQGRCRLETAANGDEHDYGRDYRERLRLLVGRAANEGVHVEKRTCCDGRRERGLAATKGADQADAQRERSDQPTQVEEGGGREPSAGIKPEVSGRPDAQRLDRRDRVEEVAEALAIGVEGLEAPELDHAGDLRCGKDEDGCDGQKRRDERVANGIESSGAHDLGDRPDPGRAHDPRKARKAVDVKGADGKQSERDALEPIPAGQSRLSGCSFARHLGEPDRERQDEQRLHRLLEGALDVVRSGQIGDAHKERRADPPRPGEAAHGAEGRDRRRNRPSHGETAERLDQRGPQLGKRGRQRVRAQRVPLVDQPLGTAVQEAIRREEMLRHIRIERGPEDPEAHLHDERDRAKDHGADDRRGETLDRFRGGLESKGGRADHGEHGNGADAGPRRTRDMGCPPRRRADQAQADRGRQG